MIYRASKTAEGHGENLEWTEVLGRLVTCILVRFLEVLRIEVLDCFQKNILGPRSTVHNIGVC